MKNLTNFLLFLYLVHLFGKVLGFFFSVEKSKSYYLQRFLTFKVSNFYIQIFFSNKTQDQIGENSTLLINFKINFDKTEGPEKSYQNFFPDMMNITLNEFNHNIRIISFVKLAKSTKSSEDIYVVDREKRHFVKKYNLSEEEVSC